MAENRLLTLADVLAGHDLPMVWPENRRQSFGQNEPSDYWDQLAYAGLYRCAPSKPPLKAGVSVRCFVCFEEKILPLDARLRRSSTTMAHSDRCVHHLANHHQYTTVEQWLRMMCQRQKNLYRLQLEATWQKIAGYTRMNDKQMTGFELNNTLE